MALMLYNSLTRKKETFTPIQKGKVGIYTCGPTVYWFAHVGNFRTYVFSDILRRVLAYNGYKVNHIMNVTDVGHLTNDSDDYGEFIDSKISLNWNKRSYEFGIFYQPHNQSGGISFGLFGFK